MNPQLKYKEWETSSGDDHLTCNSVSCEARCWSSYRLCPPQRSQRNQTSQAESVQPAKTWAAPCPDSQWIVPWDWENTGKWFTQKYITYTNKVNAALRVSDNAEMSDASKERSYCSTSECFWRKGTADAASWVMYFWINCTNLFMMGIRDDLLKFCKNITWKCWKNVPTSTVTSYQTQTLI